MRGAGADMRAFLFSLFITVSGAASAYGGEPAADPGLLSLGNFARGLDGWRVQRLDPKIEPTVFSVAVIDGVSAVAAASDKSMAMLARKIEGDIAGTPNLCWRWRIESVIAEADIRTRAGDDLAARIYVGLNFPRQRLSVVERIGLIVARRKYGDALPDSAINYVWDNRTPRGTLLPNAYTKRTQMYVLRSGNEDAGGWVEERRNILTDMERAFGAADGKPILIALASDTDNTGATARAAFADLHLVPDGEPCRFPGS